MEGDADIEMTVEWRRTRGEEDLDIARVLYAYLDRETEEIVYLGKADRCSARERADDHERDEAWLARVGLDEWDVIVGHVTEIGGAERMSVELLQDAEELLIWCLRPRGNDKVAEPRRESFRVTCVGDWPEADDDVFEDL